ncbi:hypothetical protein FRY74_06145 [Vicingus serpentipes]|uniref:DUF4252 domain-containing protein n=1 Tax=Vicingus serpentipes TaxID=1926625 RepID=A0A5C6RX19_9FLAO|nr:hypothetical protein [Vicingus serpentipes]TXB66150.1 hypothetical protein FRY74_06145 [Vicingus serpentipes]
MKSSIEKKISLILLSLVSLMSCVISDEKAQSTFDIQVSKSSDAKNGWSNPALIKGSSFGEIINTAYRLGNYQLLVRLTDSISRNELSEEEIINFYKKMNMGFKMKLQNIEGHNINYKLFYKVEVTATEQVLVMPVIIEDDTVRLELTAFIDELNNLKR